MYAQAVNAVAHGLVNGFSWPPGARDIDWSRRSRFASPTVDLENLKKGLKSFIDRFCPDLGEGLLEGVLECAPPTMRRSLTRVHDHICTPSSGMEQLVAFNSANAAHQPYRDAPCLVIFRGGVAVLAAWSSSSTRKGAVLLYVGQRETRLFDCNFKRRKFKIDQPAGALPASYEAATRFLHSIVKLHEERQRLIRETQLAPATHYLMPSEDGSLVVRRSSGSEIDNPYGPAVITATGEGLYFLMGRPASARAIDRMSKVRRQPELVSIKDWPKRFIT